MSNVIAAVTQHHAQLVAELGARVDAVQHTVRTGTEAERETAQLRTFITGELLPHARAEEGTLYPAAAGIPTLRPLVQGMLFEHEQLARLAAEVADGADGVATVAAARALLEVFTGHARRENELLLTGLAADYDVDLDALVADMHEQFTAAQHDARTAA